MSIEEEPKTVNNNEKDENIYNDIKNKKEENKINLKNIKPNILSPPDTPQISNIKKESDINTDKSNNIGNNNNEKINNKSDKTSSGNITNNSNENKEKMDNNENNNKELNNIEGTNTNNIENTNNVENINNVENTNNVDNINNVENANNVDNTNINDIENKSTKDSMDINKENNNDKVNNSQNIEEDVKKVNNDDSKKELNINNNQNNTLLKEESKPLNVDNIKSNNNKVIVKVDITNQKHLNESKKIQKMPRSEINISTNITRSLQLHPRSFPFLKPVDPVLLNIPDYFTVIKHPMDLSTIMKKIKENKYKGINEYISDVELMFNNCFIYNPPTNPVHIAGKILKDYFIEQLRRLTPEVQASLNILTKGNDNENINNGDKRPKRQIKAVNHLEPEYHIPKKMKVIHKQITNDEKEVKLQTQNLPLKTTENKSNNNVHIKSELPKKLNNITPIQNEKIKNNNKTTIKKLIAKTGKNQQYARKEDKKNNEIEEYQVHNEEIYEIGNEEDGEEEEEEDEIEEEEDDDNGIEEEEEDNDNVDDDEDNEDEDNIDENEEDEIDDDDDDDLNRKTRSIIRASQKVLSRVKSRNPPYNNTKIRKISSQTSGINKKAKKSKLLKSISKTPSLIPLPMDQLYQDNSVNNIVEMQINTLTMCLQKVTKQLELLQVQSRARKLNRQAKRLAKSLNMNDFGYPSDSDNVENLLSQTAMLTSDANNLLKRKIKTKSKVSNKPTKINKVKSKNRRNEIDNNENEEENEYYTPYINSNIIENELPKTKGKNSTTKEKSVKKETKRQKQTRIPRKRIPKGSHENSYDIKKVCEYCGDTDTPMWRRGPNGKGTLCNKCGVKWKGGKIYQGEEIPMLANKNNKSNNATKVIPAPTSAPPPKRERKTKNKTKDKEKKKETNNTTTTNTKNNKNKQQKITEITYNQKKELSEMINYLSEEKISGVVDIIKSSIPEIKDTQEEIEIDIETLNPATLYKLYNYVKKVSKPKYNKKNQVKNDDTSSGESSGESSAESDYDSSDTDSEPNQILSRR